MARRVRLTAEAEADVVRILQDSESQFGQAARWRYAGLIRTALKDLGADSQRLGVHGRADLGAHLLIYHLNHSRQRARAGGWPVRRPRHMLVFRIVGPDRLEVVRVLYDGMDIVRHLPPDERSR